MARAAGLVAASAARQAGTTARSGSGSVSGATPAPPGPSAPAAAMTVLAQASMSADGVAAP